MNRVFYRLENDYGEGPYRLRHDSKNLFNALENFSTHRLHPPPDDDPFLSHIDFTDSSWRFCFESLNALYNWFYTIEVKKALQDIGVLISIIEAEKFILGEKQAVFCVNCKYDILERIPIK